MVRLPTVVELGSRLLELTGEATKRCLMVSFRCLILSNAVDARACNGSYRPDMLLVRRGPVDVRVDEVFLTMAMGLGPLWEVDVDCLAVMPLLPVEPFWARLA